jgi:phosphatidate cytidylyltransferase
MVKQRVITSIVGLPVVIAAVWFNQPVPWFAIFAGVWGLLAVLEFYKLAGVSNRLPITWFGLAGTLLFILNPYFGFPFPVMMTSALILSLILLILSPQREGAFNRWVWMFAGMLYIGWLLSYLVALRIDGGRAWVLLALFATFGSDTAAFFIGRAFGRHRLSPRISPNKTWEGAVAGVLGAVIVCLLFTLPTPLLLPLHWTQAVALGILISVFGQFGGMVESLLKRNSGVKDSGKLIPGHGGLLDRTDSVIFAGVVVYFYFVFFAL